MITTSKYFFLFISIIIYLLLSSSLSAQSSGGISYTTLAGQQVNLQELCAEHEFNFLIFFNTSDKSKAYRSLYQLQRLERREEDYDDQIIVIAVGETKAKAKAAIQEYQKLKGTPPIPWENYKVLLDKFIYQGNDCVGLQSYGEMPCSFPTFHILDRQSNMILHEDLMEQNKYLTVNGILRDYKLKREVMESTPEGIAKEKDGAVELLAGASGAIKDLVYSDLDQDGDRDLVAVITKSENKVDVAWYRNEGDLQFSGELPLTTMLDEPGLSGPISINVGDLDGDGDSDIIVISSIEPPTRWNGSILLRNEGSGQFSLPYRLMEDAVDVRFADLDGDQDQDLISSDADGQLVWYQNEGNGRLPEAQVLNESDEEIIERIRYLTDLDGDGDIDIIYKGEKVYTGKTEQVIAWKENLGDGQFTAQQTLVEAFVEMVRPPGRPKVTWSRMPERKSYTSIRSFELVDLDGDKDRDLLVILRDRLTWLERIGPGRFSEEKVLKKGNGLGTISARVRDVNGDGLQDIAISSHSQLRLNSGNGNFLPPERLPTSKQVSLPRSFIKKLRVDLDGDGDKDLIVAKGEHYLYSGGGIGWVENKAK